MWLYSETTKHERLSISLSLGGFSHHKTHSMTQSKPFHPGDSLIFCGFHYSKTTFSTHIMKTTHATNSMAKQIYSTMTIKESTRSSMAHLLGLHQSNKYKLENIPTHANY
jgi:hypothetical protein